MLLREVDEAWATIGDCPPIGHRLKIDLRERWVRFYSLPDGQRYPQSPADHEEIHRRVDCLVSDVCDLGDDIVLVIGRYGPPGNPPPISEAQATVQVDPVHWREVNLPPDPGEDIDDNWPLHLWASLHRYAPRSLIHWSEGSPSTDWPRSCSSPPRQASPSTPTTAAPT